MTPGTPGASGYIGTGGILCMKELGQFNSMSDLRDEVQLEVDLIYLSGRFKGASLNAIIESRSDPTDPPPQIRLPPFPTHTPKAATTMAQSSGVGRREHLPRASDIHLIWTADRSRQEFDLVRTIRSFLLCLACLIPSCLTVHGRSPTSQKGRVTISVNTTDAPYTCLTAWWRGLHHVALKETKPVRNRLVMTSRTRFTTIAFSILMMSSATHAQNLTGFSSPHCEISAWQDGSPIVETAEYHRSYTLSQQLDTAPVNQVNLMFMAVSIASRHWLMILVLMTIYQRSRIGQALVTGRVASRKKRAPYVLPHVGAHIGYMGQTGVLCAMGTLKLMIRHVTTNGGLE